MATQDQNKINRRSANITEGVARAPNRSMYYAMGYTEGDFGKPMVGVAFLKSEAGISKMEIIELLRMDAVFTSRHGSVASDEPRS